MEAKEVLSLIFQNFLSRHEENLIRRCNEIMTADGKIWGEAAWQRVKDMGWVRPLKDGRSYERLCPSVLRKLQNN